MRVLLLSVGSRGDTEPFCSLANVLLKNGIDVEYALQKDMNYLVPSGVNVHALPFEASDFYKFMDPSHGKDHPNPRVRFIGIIADVIAELVLPCWKQILDVAATCDVIICSSLARSLSFALTQKLSIATYLLHLQPLFPTALFPHYSHTDECVDCLTKNSKVLEPKYLEGYWELERFQYDFLNERLNKVYMEMDLKPLLTFDETKKILSGHASDVHIVNAFSNAIIPTVPDSGPNVYDVGPLADSYVPQNFDVPKDDSDVQVFLKEKKPICIGFGSMPYDPSKVVGLLKVVQDLNQAVILVGKALKLPESTETVDSTWVEQNVRHVDVLPYAWLLPRCSVMVCHGGAGVVNATLRVGIPIVISPLMGDQFTFAKLLEAKGLGSQAGNHMNTMTQDEFKAALEKAMKCKEAAATTGLKIQSWPNGVDTLYRILVGDA